MNLLTIRSTRVRGKGEAGAKRAKRAKRARATWSVEGSRDVYEANMYPNYRNVARAVIIITITIISGRCSRALFAIVARQ